MRIIQVCTANSLGGLELYFASCCKILKQRGNEVLAIASAGSRLHEILAETEVECQTIEGNIWNRVTVFKRSITRFRPAVIHVHHKKDLLLGALTRTFSGVPYKYVHTRQMDLPGNKKNPYHTFIYGRIDLLIAITNRLKSQIVERINIKPQKVISLYYGVPLTKPNTSRCASLGLDLSKFKIAVVARIDNKKEQHVIVEAISHLKKAGIDNVTVHLLGGSTDRDYLAKITTLIEKNGLGDRIVLSGFIENPQELMSCFDLVVLTTGNETFGLVLPEAMRMGVAVIGANGGGVSEIIDHEENGLLFEPGDGEDLAQKIKLIMHDKTRTRLAQHGKKKADEQFELNSHFEKLEKVFSKLLIE